MWQGMVDVAGSRDGAMMGLKKAFGTYNHAEDPEFMQDMQFLQQNPTQQVMGAFYEKWEPYLDGKTIQDIAGGLSYVEGTNQWYENQLNKNALSQSNTKTKALPQLTANQLKLSDYQVQKAGLDAQYNPTFYAQRAAQGEQSLTQNQQAIDTNAIKLKYLEPQLTQQLTAGEIANDIRNLDLAYRQESDPMKLQMLENDMILANETLQDKIDLSGLQVRTGRAGARTAESNARVAEGTEDPRISSAESDAYLNQLRAELMDKTLDAQVAAPYIANSGNILRNNNQVMNNRILAETQDNIITQTDLETELLRLQRDQAQDKYNFMSGLDNNTRYGLNTGNQYVISAEDWLPTPEGTPQLALNDRDTVVYAATGQPYTDENGNAFVAEEGFLNGERVFKSIKSDNYLSGSGNLSDFQKTGDEESGDSWGVRTWNNIISNITGNNQNQQNNSPEELYNQFKTNTQSDVPLTASQIKGKINMIDDTRFQQLYGMPKSQFIDYLNRF